MTPMATSTQTFAIFNVGTEDLLLTGTPSVTLTGDSEFTVSSQPSSTTIVQSDSTNFEITFTPVTIGVYNATVTIPNSDADENPFTFAVSGKGVRAAGGGAINAQFWPLKSGSGGGFNEI